MAKKNEEVGRYHQYDHIRVTEARDKVIRFIMGKEEGLTEYERNLYEMVDFADNVIREWGPSKKAQEMICTKFEVSMTTAIRVVHDAQYIFGSTRTADKAFWRNTILTGLVQAFNAAMQNLVMEEIEDNGEKKSVFKKGTDPKELRAIAELAEEIRKTVGYDIPEDPDIPDWTKIGANPISVTTDPKEIGLKAISNIDEIRRILSAPPAEDVEYTEE